MNPVRPPKSILQANLIREVILNDFDRIMKIPGSTISKFLLIVVGIEYLGACLDKQDMKATARGEKRFNLAMLKLFPKKYHHFLKKEAVPNLYRDFRCPVIHQFKPEKSIILCSADEQPANNFRHLSYHPDGSLVLIAEEFFNDLTGACNEMILRLGDRENL